MPAYRYRIVDVFTETPFEGNPLAVFPDGLGLSATLMQRIAGELNLSETVFVLPATTPRSVACARIFTPRDELPFAGHPTVGTAYVLCACGVVDAAAGEFYLEEGIGPVRVRVERTPRFSAWLTTPAIVFGEVFERAAFALALGLDDADCLDVPAQAVSAGVPAVFIALRDRAAVDRAAPDAGALRAALANAAIHETFVFAPTPEGAYARMFAPELGIAEDPATGGLTGPLAAYMMRYGLCAHSGGTRIVSEQGVKMGRRSLLQIRVHGEYGADGIEVGGSTTPIADGVFYLPPSTS